MIPMLHYFWKKIGLQKGEAGRGSFSFMRAIMSIKLHRLIFQVFKLTGINPVVLLFILILFTGSGFFKTIMEAINN